MQILKDNTVILKAAKPLYQKMVDVVNETGSSAKSTALLISGHNLLFNGEFDEGIKMYDEAIAIAATPNWSFRLSTIYKTVGYLFKGDYYAAQNLLKETYKTIEETSNSEEQVNQNRVYSFLDYDDDTVTQSTKKGSL